MPFSRVLYPKMCSCSYHKASLTVTILTMSTKLRKAIYSLNQAPSAWYHELHQCLVSFGFNNSHADTSVFVSTTMVQYVISLFMLMTSLSLVVMLGLYKNLFTLYLSDSHLKTLDLYRTFLELKSLHTLKVSSSVNNSISLIYSLELACLKQSQLQRFLPLVQHSRYTLAQHYMIRLSIGLLLVASSTYHWHNLTLLTQ